MKNFSSKNNAYKLISEIKNYLVFGELLETVNSYNLLFVKKK